MGKVGRVGDWKGCCVEIRVGLEKYYYNRKTDIWCDNEGETDFEIEFDLGSKMVRFDAEGRKFVDKYGLTLPVEGNAITERVVKERLVKKPRVNGGLCYVFVPGATGAITINDEFSLIGGLKKYDMNGQVSFYRTEREGMPIYRN